MIDIGEGVVGVYVGVGVGVKVAVSVSVGWFSLEEVTEVGVGVNVLVGGFDVTEVTTGEEVAVFVGERVAVSTIGFDAVCPSQDSKMKTRQPNNICPYFMPIPPIAE